MGNIRYTTVAEAVAAANGKPVKLLANSNEKITVSGDLYLDLNGYTLAELTITDGTLYGMDTTTDDYSCTGGYGKIATLNGNYAAHHQLADNLQRYLAVEEGSGVSFHRFYLGITHKSLQPGAKGVGYKALFAGDDLVKQQLAEAEAFGYTLQLGNYNSVSRWMSRQDFAANKAVSLRVKNYDPAYGETELKANVQMKLANGEVITSGLQTMTLKDTVTQVNTEASGYSQVQLEAMSDWLKSSAIMMDWDVENILQRDLCYDMNGGKDMTLDVDVSGKVQSIAVKGTDLVLKDATIENGVLTIPAKSFVQKFMPSGRQILAITTDTGVTHCVGDFTWVITTWGNTTTGLAYAQNHLNGDATNYTGLLALGADIDLTGAKVGNFTMFKKDTVFNGSFDGRNYTISGMAPTNTTALFGTLGEKGIIKNLQMTDLQIAGYGAGVSYFTHGTIENVFVQGTITGDGMGATSNLGNFGCGLLAGQYYATAKVSNCMVELSAITEDLRLATAFGKLRDGVSEDIFTNCDAIGADSCTYMQYANKTWTKSGFTADTNANFTDRNTLMFSNDGVLRYLALRPKVDFVEQDTLDYTVPGAIHQYNITSTDSYLVQNGACKYTIIRSKSADEKTKTAATDFAQLFRTATGLRLATKNAEDVSFSETSQYIVIGDNAISRAVGVTAEGLGKQGFRIKTVGKSIFIVGADSQGNQYGTYELLKQLFDYECFGVDGSVINQGVKNVPFMNYDIADVPDIGVRRSNYHYVTMDSVTERRMRLTYFGDYIIPVGEKMVHNSSQYISKEDYPDKTAWFSTDGENLCYTAHGDAAELAQMQTIIANRIIKELDANPNKNVIGMMQEDNATLCDCDSCKALQEHYNGAQVGSVIIFLNEVCEMVDSHYGGKRDFTVLFFAYHATNQPPVVWNEETGAYEPIDEKVILNDHLSPYFADTDGDYTKTFYDPDSANVEYAQNLTGWTALSENIHLWIYGTNFCYYLVPYNTFDGLQGTIHYATQNNVTFLYDQGQASQTPTATGWSNLKVYLMSQLGWNVNQDQDALIDRFMEGYYGPAADTVKEVFYSWKYWANYQTNELGAIGSRTIYHDLLKAKYWNPAVLMDWTAKLEQAMQELDPSDSNYNLYLKNIATERIAYNFILLQRFQGSMTAEQIALAKEQFYHDYQLAPIAYQQDRKEPVSDLLIKWGIISE